MSVTISVLAERAPGEARVSVVPEIAERLTGAGARVLMERGAGEHAQFPDALYRQVQWAADGAAALAAADVLLTVQPPSVQMIDTLRAGSVVIGFMLPHARHAEVRALRDRQITSFAMELVPRISRAQSMDALSSQAAVAGYKAVLIAANTLDRFLPMLTTAAGTIRPAQVLIIGVGVAGLQAIATARRLGAMVEAYDVRSATREQVRSLGAKFIDTGVSAEGTGGYARELTPEERARQQEILDARIAAADAVITTAAVPGRPAPRIVSAAAVARMKAGAVVVDIAAESGGNCELTQPGRTTLHQGVRIIGPVNLPAQLAYHASEMYSRNLYNFLKPALVKPAGEQEATLTIDWQDEVYAQACLTHAGVIRHEATRKLLEAS